MSHEGEPHDESLSQRLNWLRAGVLGANDGTTDRRAILVAGVAGLSAGAMSMAVGEYVSVSTQHDSEKALLALEKQELREMPREELDELTGIYEEKGLAPNLAREVAVALAITYGIGTLVGGSI